MARLRIIFRDGHTKPSGHIPPGQASAHPLLIQAAQGKVSSQGRFCLIASVRRSERDDDSESRRTSYSAHKRGVKGACPKPSRSAGACSYLRAHRHPTGCYLSVVCRQSEHVYADATWRAARWTWWWWWAWFKTSCVLRLREVYRLNAFNQIAAIRG